MTPSYAFRPIEGLGLRKVQMAGLLGLAFRHCRAGGGEMELHDNDLFLRICRLCGPVGKNRAAGTSTDSPRVRSLRSLDSRPWTRML